MTTTLLPEGTAPAWVPWGERRSKYEVELDEKIKARVQRGLAWLEKTHGPGWEAKIDLEQLTLMDGDRCVLGQVYHDEATEQGNVNGYEYAISLYGAKDEDPNFANLGFVAMTGPEWPELQRAWEEVLA